MAANRTAFVLEQVRSLLDTEPTFTVHSVHRTKTNEGINVYPFVVAQTMGAESLENFTSDGTGVMELGLLIEADVATDAANAGLGTNLYGVIVERIEDLFADWEVTLSSGNRPKETHSSGKFKTDIYGVRITKFDGHYDRGGNRITVGCQILIYYAQEAL